MSLLLELVSLLPISEGTEEYRTEDIERESLSTTTYYYSPTGIIYSSIRPKSKTRLLITADIVIVPYLSPRRSIQSNLLGLLKFLPKIAIGLLRDPIGYYNYTKPKSSNI